MKNTESVTAIGGTAFNKLDQQITKLVNDLEKGNIDEIEIIYEEGKATIEGKKYNNDE